MKKEEEDASRARLEHDFPVVLPDVPPQTINLTFLKGVPVAINGCELSFVELVEKLNFIGLEYGLPWKASIESRPTGRGEVEWNRAPGVDALREACGRLRAACVPPRQHQELFRFNAQVAEDIIRGGLHNTTTLGYLNMIREICKNVSGRVDLTFYPGFVRASRPQPFQPITVAETCHPCPLVPSDPISAVRALIAHNVVDQAIRRHAVEALPRSLV